MTKKYFIELYFHKDNKSSLEDKPNLDNYLSNTEISEIVANSWKEVKDKIIIKYPNIAYIHLLESRNMNI